MGRGHLLNQEHGCPTQVYGLPTVMLFKDGKKVESSHAEVAITLPKLRTYLEKHGIAAAAAAAS